jgi:hypothetical protein
MYGVEGSAGGVLCGADVGEHMALYQIEASTRTWRDAS